MRTIDARYVASTPNSLLQLPRELDETERSTLATIFYGDDLRQVASSRPRQQAPKIKRALYPRSSDEALKIASAVVTFLKTAFAMLDVPPSEDELEEFIKNRRLRVTNSAHLRGIHAQMTAGGADISAFIDPYTKDFADPLMWILAIERVEEITEM
jgi:hypothetical protein